MVKKQKKICVGWDQHWEMAKELSRDFLHLSRGRRKILYDEKGIESGLDYAKRIFAIGGIEL